MHELELPALHLINYSDPVSGGSDSSPLVRLTECPPLLSSPLKLFFSLKSISPLAVELHDVILGVCS